MTPPWFYRAIPVHQNQRFAVAKGLKLGHRDKWPFCIAPGTCLSSIFGLEPSKRRPKLHSKQGAPFGLQVYMSCNCWRLENPWPLAIFPPPWPFDGTETHWDDKIVGKDDNSRWSMQVTAIYIYRIYRDDSPPRVTTKIVTCLCNSLPCHIHFLLEL